MANDRPHQMRRDQADETNGASDGHRPPDAERDAHDHDEPELPDLDAKALRRFLAEAEGTERIALAPQDARAGHDERQRQHDVTETAILQRAEQPERNFEHHEGIAG